MSFSDPFSRARWYSPIGEFIVHAIVGSALFVVVLFPAIGLDLLSHYLESNYQLSVLVVYAMKLVEYMLLGVDLLLFIVFLLRSVARAISQM